MAKISKSPTYRLSLTKIDIETIMTVLLRLPASQWSGAEREVYKKLHLMNLKIQADAVVPTRLPPPMTERNSGIGAMILDTFIATSPENSGSVGESENQDQRSEDFKNVRLRAFQKWNQSPTLCSVRELELAITYRYENDLMNEQERDEYEESLMRE
jgi:hypothetical protein